MMLLLFINIRISSKSSTPFNAQYFTSKLTNPHLDNIGLTSQTTPLGEAIVIDPDKIGNITGSSVSVAT